MTKSRKRMLISSIAMLLVALVALGSATYAWFSISKTVKADTMQVKAIAAAGLEISKEADANYSPTRVSFSGTTEIKPVSWVPDASQTNHGFVPSGNIDSPGGGWTGAYKDTNLTPSTDAQNAYFKTFDVWVRSAQEGTKRVSHGVSATVKVEDTGTTNNAKTFVRAYLIDNSTTTNSQTFSNAVETTAAISGATAGTTTDVSSIAFGTAKTVTATPAVASAAATDEGIHYTLVLWFEGTDAQCVDGNKEAVANVTVEFTATDM